ncbi:Putative clathrin assembly protein At1g33340 [Linum grandiflorum]
MMGVDLQGRLRLALGTVKDHASIGKAIIHMTHHDAKIGFPYLEIALVRATGHHYSSNIDDKHLHEILFLANSPASIPFLAERISRRLSKTRDRLVALKTLLLLHRLLRAGNRCFEHQLRRAHTSGHLQITANWFSSSQQSSGSLRFLHNYSAYLEERIATWVINQSGKLEPSVIQGLELGSHRHHNHDHKAVVDMVFRKLPKCQALIDKVLDCFPFTNSLPTFDTLYGATMTNILKESFQVYTTYSEGVTALMNIFFDLTQDARALACQILRRASRQTQLLHLMYDTCKKIIRNENLEYPLVEIINTEHVMALGQLQLCNTDDVAVTSLVKDCTDQNDGSDADTVFSFGSTMETKISKVWVVFEDEFR